MPTNLTPEQIIAIVDAMERDRSDLHAIMDGDMDLYHQVPYQPKELKGFKNYTSNNPTTTMDLALHLGSSARRIVRVHQPRVQKDQREVDNYEELFCLGILNAVDDLRADRLAPDLHTAMMAQSTYRGRIAQRVLLVKEEIPGRREEIEQFQQRQTMLEQQGMMGMVLGEEPSLTRTYADVTDWDPRNTYWQMGLHGLEWACHKSAKTRAQIMSEYGIDPEEGDKDPVGQNDTIPEYAVYDFFDDTDNMVIVG